MIYLCEIYFIIFTLIVFLKHYYLMFDFVFPNRDDFLALFESSIQPKIKTPAAKSKKPGPNAVKVLWQQPVCFILVS